MSLEPLTNKQALRIHSERLRGEINCTAPNQFRAVFTDKSWGKSVLELSLSADCAGTACINRREDSLRGEVLDEALVLARAVIQARREGKEPTKPELFLPLTRKKLEKLHKTLHLPTSALDKCPAFAEACCLQSGGLDCFGRPFRLHPVALRAWQSLQAAAAQDGILLAVASAFRSYAYQSRLIQKKQQAGQRLDAILRVNAPPGHSEHHTGMAVDIHCPEEPNAPEPLTEAFESSRAFAWLKQHGQQFGFHLSYPRDNPHGFIYEPWHWCFHPFPTAHF